MRLLTCDCCRSKWPNWLQESGNPESVDEMQRKLLSHSTASESWQMDANGSALVSRSQIQMTDKMETKRKKTSFHCWNLEENIYRVPLPYRKCALHRKFNPTLVFPVVCWPFCSVNLKKNHWFAWFGFCERDERYNENWKGLFSDVSKQNQKKKCTHSDWVCQPEQHNWKGSFSHAATAQQE